MAKEQNRNYPPITPNTYTITLPVGEEFEFVSAHTIFPYQIYTSYSPISENHETYIQDVYIDNENVFHNQYRIRHNPQGTAYRGENIGFKIKLKENSIYKVVYTYDAFSQRNTSKDYSFTNTVEYTFATVENKLPLKKWSITDVINRTLDLAEPLRKGEKSRFKLGMKWDGTILPNTQADKFNKILAPQFSFTKQTLRECLQEIGKVIHGEPRLSIQKDEDGYFYEVSYDMYASQEKSNLHFMPFTSKSAQHVIENYKEIHRNVSYSTSLTYRFYSFYARFRNRIESN